MIKTIKLKSVIFLLVAAIAMTIVFASCGSSVGGLDSNKVSIYGKVYEFPFKGSDLLDGGWSIGDGENEFKNYNNSTHIRLYNADGVSFSVDTTTELNDQSEFSECEITSANFSEDFLRGENSLVLPGGITPKNTRDEVINVYGLPDDSNKEFEHATDFKRDNDDIRYENQKSSGMTVHFNFDGYMNIDNVGLDMGLIEKTNGVMRLNP